MVIHKAPLLDERGNHKLDEAGKPRYLCGFRIAGGIDQDNSKSPQGYPDKVNLTITIMIIIIIFIIMIIIIITIIIIIISIINKDCIWTIKIKACIQFELLF